MSLQISGGTIGNLSGLQTWTGGGLRDFWFDVPAAPSIQQRVVGAATVSEVQVEDRIYDRVNDSGAVSVTDFYWPITIPADRKTTEMITRSSSSPSVIAPDPINADRWVWLADGTATLTISCPSRTATAVVTAATLGVVDVFGHFAVGSLRRHLIETVDGALSGLAASASKAVFTTQNHAAGIYVRNSGCWASYADLTPISPWNSEAANLWAGILISPRHVLFCAHASISVGAVMRFIKADNTVVERTLTAITTYPGYAAYYPDLRVGVLDSDVPAGIGFARVLPDAWTSKLPSLNTSYRLPALVLDQEEKALVADLASITSAAGMYGAMAAFTRPPDHQRQAFYEDLVGGDSGNPACLIINGQLVVLNVWTFGGGGSGTSVVYHKAGINALMTALGGGYQLTEVDLSGFPSY